jgi:YidC/Oxa1 family membrane protein insertase
MPGLTELWNLVIMEPMLNLLVLLYSVLFNNFVLAIIGLTIVIRLLTFPLTQKQIRSMKAMQGLQPEIQKLQKKYAKDREKLSAATMELYKEHGVNPMMGCFPMLIQMPIWIGLYQSIYQALGSTPEQFVVLSQRLYHTIPFMHDIAARALPLNSRFLWLDLGRPDPWYVLPVLVVLVFWLQQKLTTQPAVDPSQAQMNSTMQVMMPLMFGVITLQVSSGLAVYWVASGVLQIIQQGLTTGWGDVMKALPAGLPGLPRGEEPGKDARADKKRKKR